MGKVKDVVVFDQSVYSADGEYVIESNEIWVQELGDDIFEIGVDSEIDSEHFGCQHITREQLYSIYAQLKDYFNDK